MKKKLFITFSLVLTFIFGITLFSVDSSASELDHTIDDINYSYWYDDVDSFGFTGHQSGYYYCFKEHLNHLSSNSYSMNTLSFDIGLNWYIDELDFDNNPGLPFYYLLSDRNIATCDKNFIDFMFSFATSGFLEINLVNNNSPVAPCSTIFFDISDMNNFIDKNYYLYVIVLDSDIYDGDDSAVFVNDIKYYSHYLSGDIYDKYNYLFEDYQHLLDDYDSLLDDFDVLSTAYENLKIEYKAFLDGDTTFTSLFWTIATVPFESFKTIWNVEFLGVNLAGVVTGLLMGLIAIYILKKVLL